MAQIVDTLESIQVLSISMEVKYGNLINAISKNKDKYNYVA